MELPSDARKSNSELITSRGKESFRFDENLVKIARWVIYCHLLRDFRSCELFCLVQKTTNNPAFQFLSVASLRK